jgi:hypothetical protein
MEKYHFNSYADYLKTQKRFLYMSQNKTTRKEGRRRWAWNYIQQHTQIKIKSILCVGCRDVCEMATFKNLGVEDVDGIDLAADRGIQKEGIIVCDMSRMKDHPLIGIKKYDLVVSLESIEHCYDLEGFIEGLNQICTEYFFCLTGNHPHATIWDVATYSFMTDNVEIAKEELVKTFTAFDVVDVLFQKNLCFLLRKKLHPPNLI